MAESFDLGSAHAQVLLSTDGISSGVAEAQRIFDRGLSSIGDSISRFGDQMSGLGTAITKLTAPLTVFGVTGLKVAADFETVMKSIELFGGVTGAELEKVRKFVLKMGADTVFTAEDAGNAMLDLLKSGLSLAEATAALPQVLDLATAGNLSLANAAGIVSAGLAQFGLKAKDAKRVTNALAQAANASRADVADLGQGLANVGPIAARFGLSIEDTAAVLGVFSNNGIMGAEAGTQLKSMLLNLSRPTDKVKDAMKKLGISLYDAKGNTKDFNTFIKELDASLKKLPVQEQNELMQDLAGSYGITGLSALRASGGIDNMNKAMKAAPTATDLAAGAANTFARNLESLKGSVETLQTEALTPFMQNVLTPLIKQGITFVNTLTEWVNKNPALTAQIVQIGAALVVLGPALFIAGQAISAIGVVIGFVLSPVGLLIGGILALVAAFNSNFLGLRDTLEPIIKAIIKFFTGEDSLEAAFKALTTEGGPVKLFQNFMSNVADLLSRAANSARELGQMGLVVVAETLGKAADAAKKLLDIGMYEVARILKEASESARELGFITLFKVAETLDKAANAARNLLDLGLLLVADTLKRASDAAGELVAIVELKLLGVVKQFSDGALDLAGRLAEVSTNVGYLLVGLGSLLLILTAARLIAMVQALATAVIAVATAIAGGGGLMLALNPLTLILLVVAALTLAATTNFLGFGDRLKDVKNIIDEAVTSARQLADILQALIDKINWIKGNPIQTNLPGVSITNQGGIGINQPFDSPATQNFQNRGGMGSFPSVGQWRDSGGPGMANLPYLIGTGAQPELFTPQTSGSFTPVDKLLQQLAEGNGNGGINFAPGSVVIHANSQAEGRAAGDAFGARLTELLARRG